MMSRKLIRNWLPSKYVYLVLVGFLAISCTSISRIVDKNGTYLIVRLEKESLNDEQAIENAVSVLESRLDFMGIRGEVSSNHPEATAPNQIVIDIYGKSDIEKRKDFLLRRSDFQLRSVRSKPSPHLPQHPSLEEAEKTKTESDEVVSYDKTEIRGFLVLEKEPIVLGSEIRNASAVQNEGADDYSIQFSLKPEGAVKFGTWTEKNINQFIAAVFNGEVVSIAFIKVKITDEGMISAHDSKEEAEELALLMRSGYFPHTLELVDQKRYGD